MKTKKITALLLSASMLLLTACSSKTADDTASTTKTAEEESYVQPYYSKPATSVMKTETVYVNLNSDGKVKEVNVSDWLHTDTAEVYVDDRSNLKNITNIKSKIQPVVDGERLRWNMNETDLYYSGKSDKPLPLEIQIKYFLNGKEIKADDIAGKSGDVRIDIKMINKAFKNGKVNGKDHKVYLPMIVVGGMILPERKFSSVSVKNGQSLGDGTKEIVVFTGMPGFSESLGINKNGLGEVGGLIIGDEVSITAKTEDFGLENMYFAALPIASLNLDFAMPETVDELKTMLASLKSFQNAINKLDPNKILYSLLTDKEKVQSLIGVLDDTVKIYSKNTKLIKLLAKYATPENAEALKALLESLNDPDVKAALGLLSDPAVKRFLTLLPGLMNEFENVSPLLSSLQKEMEDPAIQKEIAALPETIGYLNNITRVISENANELDTLVSILGDDGSKVFEELIKSLDTQELSSIFEKYGDAVGDSSVLFSLAEEWLNFGREYGLFTESTENMKTSLAFIYNTPSIEKAVAAESKAVDESTLPWYKRLFS